jgi:hypothetical protein
MNTLLKLLCFCSPKWMDAHATTWGIPDSDVTGTINKVQRQILYSMCCNSYVYVGFFKRRQSLEKLKLSTKDLRHKS